ncbi:hypothetical protein V6N13_102036 [Hibiscus sabdariffa]
MMGELRIVDKREKNSEPVEVNVEGHDDVLGKSMNSGLDRKVEAQDDENKDNDPTRRQLNSNSTPIEDIEGY